MSIIHRHGLPHAPPGLRVGLLGGSFDPPHSGHVHITREALRRLGLDRVWWLVSPGNPLKARGPAPMAARLAAARAVMDHPRVEITDIEARLNSRYTARTIVLLQRLYPGVRFVWLMGADNLAGFHRWEDWQSIMERVPVAVFARPGARVRARRSKAALRFAQDRVKARDAGMLALHRPPAWVFLNVPMRDISSTGLRAGGGWPSGSGS
ncbi:nicotinate-nucleotide adenylyltransferase [Alkalilacustris brevis]|uniref:nicotinate-nucleotide adenylyltransferase n=1 Tax=Alkalilacustris brevis TaxID=2026338 RepID=UPI000E0D16AF|nr:nicotinate-nucleotide adenylyltransferase [Alkalilacustris brevis]